MGIEDWRESATNGVLYGSVLRGTGLGWAVEGGREGTCRSLTSPLVLCCALGVCGLPCACGVTTALRIGFWGGGSLRAILRRVPLTCLCRRTVEMEKIWIVCLDKRVSG